MRFAPLAKLPGGLIACGLGLLGRPAEGRWLGKDVLLCEGKHNLVQP